MNSKASSQVSIPPIPLIGIPFSFSFFESSYINLRAIGLTALPEYPDT